MITTLIKIITIDCDRVSWKSKVTPLSERQFTGNTIPVCAFALKSLYQAGCNFHTKQSPQNFFIARIIVADQNNIGVKHGFHKIIIAQVALITQVTSEVGSCD